MPVFFPTAVGHRSGQGCSAPPLKKNPGRARACAGEHRRGLRPCAEKNRRGAPRRRRAHTPVDAHASERARAGTNIASSAQGPPPFDVRGKETQERRKKLGGPWLDGGTPALARRPELPAAAAMPPSPASSARTVASIGEKRKGRRAREKRKEARRESAMARRADRPARRQDATGGGAGPELGHKERENG